MAVRDRAHPASGRCQRAISAAATVHAPGDLARGVVVSLPTRGGPRRRGPGSLGLRRLVRFEPTPGRELILGANAVTRGAATARDRTRPADQTGLAGP